MMRHGMRPACWAAVLCAIVFAGCFKANINPKVDITGFGGDDSQPRSSTEYTYVGSFDRAYAAAVTAMKDAGVKMTDLRREEDDDREEAKLKGIIGNDVSVETKLWQQKDPGQIKIRIRVKGSRTLAGEIERDLRRKL